MRGKAASQISPKLPANHHLFPGPGGHLKIVVSPVRVWVSPFLQSPECGLVLRLPSGRFGGALEARFCARGPFQVRNLRVVVEGLAAAMVLYIWRSGARFWAKGARADDRCALSLIVQGGRGVGAGPAPALAQMLLRSRERHDDDAEAPRLTRWSCVTTVSVARRTFILLRIECGRHEVVLR